LIARKIIKIVAHRFISYKVPKYAKNVCAAGGPAGGAYRLPIPLAGFKGPTFGIERAGRRREGKEKEKDGRTGWEKGKWREGAYRHFFSPL